SCKVILWASRATRRIYPSPSLSSNRRLRVSLLLREASRLSSDAGESQHDVLPGMTCTGKSVIVTDLPAKIGHRFGFRLIVEEGLSHAVLTQTQGCQPIIMNPDG